MCKLKHKTGKHNDARGHDVTTLQFILLVCVLIEEIQKVYILIGLCVCIRICESISWRNTFGPIKLQLALSKEHTQMYLIVLLIRQTENKMEKERHF